MSGHNKKDKSCKSGRAKGCCNSFDDIAHIYKALGHPVRLMILKKLAAQNHQCCGDICSHLPLAQSTVSQHLKVLKECGFIEWEAAGQQSRYRINRQRVEWFLAANEQFIQALTEGSDEG